MIRDYYSGKDNGVNLIAEATLELDNFRKFRGWFGEEVTRTLAAKVDPSQFLERGSGARAEAAAVADDGEDDLDSVDVDEDAEYEGFLEELYSPSDRPKNKFLVGYFLLVHVADVWQAPPYGPPYGGKPPTVPTVNPTATLKTVGAIPLCLSFRMH